MQHFQTYKKKSESKYNEQSMHIWEKIAPLVMFNLWECKRIQVSEDFQNDFKMLIPFIRASIA